MRPDLLVVGIAALVGGLLPLILPAGLGGGITARFPQFSLLSDSSVPVMIVLWLIWPMLAGIVLLITWFCGQGKLLAIMAIALGGVAFLLSLLITRDGISAPGLPGALSRQGNIIILWAHTACLWFIGIYAGLRIQMVQPGSIFARRLGGICGALLLVWHVLPIFPEGTGRVPIVLLIKGLASEGASVSSVLLGVLSTLAVLFPAVVACMNWQSKRMGKSRMTAKARMVYLLYFPAMLLLLQYYPLMQIPAEFDIPSSFYVIPIPNTIKIVCIFGGLYGMLSLGVVHLHALRIRRDQLNQN